jgi:hypothetical protein
MAVGMEVPTVRQEGDEVITCPHCNGRGVVNPPKFKQYDRVIVTQECTKYVGWKGIILAVEMLDDMYVYEVELRFRVYATINERFLEFGEGVVK